ncbi:DUF1972 domain-containing protein [Propioniciclava soli]|uniref:DUF1972 domain-containing protein n=1 Tax=Propioniciclava soli TaxID=2775081 RepID=UPI0022B7937D|nr:DUF1972 domain-containing protein [Propioniciclava soli]
MIGTRGVPARYGGFETAIEEVGSRLADSGHRVTVFRRHGDPAQRERKGMEPACRAGWGSTPPMRRRWGRPQRH